MADRAVTRPFVFISHSKRNSPEVDRILRDLEKAGIRCWMDSRNIRPATKWPEAIIDGIGQSRAMVLVLSEDANGSAHVQREVERAANQDLPIITFRIRDTTPSRYLEYFLADTQWLDAFEPPLERHIQRLVATIASLPIGDPRSNEPAPAALDSLAPAVGLPGEIGVHHSNGARLCRVPPPVRTFTARDADIEALQRTLAARRWACLCGLPGIGKSQIAVEFAYRSRAAYHTILWCDAETHDSLAMCLCAAGRWLGLYKGVEVNRQVALEEMKEWLSAPGWLLIADNVGDPWRIGELVPLQGPGHVLLTSRQKISSVIAEPVDVPELRPEDGAQLLLCRAGLLGADPAIRESALKIHSELGGHPLALDQAGAYVEENNVSLDEYLELWRSHKRKFLAERGRIAASEHHPESVLVAFSIAFEQVKKASRAAADVLRACAFLAPMGVPEELFEEGGAQLGPFVKSAVSDRIRWNPSIAPALNLSLLRRDPRSRTLVVHRLVQDVLVAEMSAKTKALWLDRTIAALSVAFPDPADFMGWDCCNRMLAHAMKCVADVLAQPKPTQRGALLLRKTGLYLIANARYEDGRQLLEAAHKIVETTMGPDHVETATCLTNLAFLCEDRLRFDEAESGFEKALAIVTARRGDSHPETATCLNNLALLYKDKGALARSQGRIDEAERLFAKAGELFERASRIVSDTLGSRHREMATCLTNLALLSKDTKGSSDAGRLFLDALDVARGALGDSSFGIVSYLNNLAFFYKDAGVDAEAERLFERALTIAEKELGPDHLETATCLTNLAFFYKDQARIDDAEGLFRRAAQNTSSSLGAGHPRTAVSNSNLGILLVERGKSREAVEVLRPALRVLQQHWGYLHDGLLPTLQALATALKAVGNAAEADAMTRRSKAIRPDAETRPSSKTCSVDRSKARTMVGHNVEESQPVRAEAGEPIQVHHLVYVNPADGRAYLALAGAPGPAGMPTGWAVQSCPQGETVEFTRDGGVFISDGPQRAYSGPLYLSDTGRGELSYEPSRIPGAYTTPVAHDNGFRITLAKLPVPGEQP